MALNFANNNSLSAITTKPSGLSSGSMNLISTQTASSSSSVQFTTGIDSTYDSYIFKFINIHPADDDRNLYMVASTDGGSNYTVNATNTFFLAYNYEDGTTGTGLQYQTGSDVAQGYPVRLLEGCGNANDEHITATLNFYNPSSSTFVKHFMCRGVRTYFTDAMVDDYSAGYFNTTSPINAVKFYMQDFAQSTTSNFDGVIKLYGIS